MHRRIVTTTRRVGLYGTAARFLNEDFPEVLGVSYTGFAIACHSSSHEQNNIYYSGL
jgi:hypothetical protein